MLALVLAGAVVSGCTSTVSTNHSGEIDNPPPSSIIVCHGYDCTYRDRLQVTPADASRYAQIMAAGRGNAAAERQAIAKAIVHFEERSAAMLGKRTTPMSQFKNSGVRGEMDCIDEATNSQSLMRYLEGRGLLKHHKVGANVARGVLIAGQCPPHGSGIVMTDDGGPLLSSRTRAAVQVTALVRTLAPDSGEQIPANYEAYQLLHVLPIPTEQDSQRADLARPLYPRLRLQ